MTKTRIPHSLESPTVQDIMFAATETPTLSTDDILALLGDDAVQNATLVIPMEKEQPRGWALDVIIIFLSGAFLLFVGTFVKQWRKRQSYSHVPTSLVV